MPGIAGDDGAEAAAAAVEFGDALRQFGEHRVDCEDGGSYTRA
eukprot:gene21359-27971_t